MAADRGDVFGVVKWMLVGLVQTAVWGVIALGLTILRRPSRAEALDRAARGLGKVLWTRGFEPKLYGAAMLSRAPR